jgi:hypothetical protein
MAYKLANVNLKNVGASAIFSFSYPSNVNWFTTSINVLCTSAGDVLFQGLFL